MKQSTTQRFILIIIKHRNDKQSGRGGGVLLYIHYSLNFTPCTEINNLKIEDSIWGSIELTSNETLFVGVVYRFPCSNVNNKKLNEAIQRIYQSCSFTQLLLMGDLIIQKSIGLP